MVEGKGQEKQMKGIRTRTLVFLFLGLALLCAAFLLITSNASYQKGTVRIYKSGELVEQIALNTVKVPVTVSAGSGNTVEVTNKGARMVHANCPDQVCVHQGLITLPLYPIVCLPNQVVVRIMNDNDNGLDAVSMPDAPGVK